ncbi:MAG: multidrug efflux MFS transporter [Lachnospiraceae bacterium]|nr:multidrug efflux MFS transporter [Lachnospiraceae bacterium]
MDNKIVNNKKSISDLQRTGILVTLLAAAFITSMSTTVTGNMIPNFTEFFGVSSNLAQWLTSGATLISGITIPITAFLIKRMPNKIYFFSAMTAFTTGSLAAFLAFNFPMLLVSRLVQAIGCGMLLSFAQIVLLKLYPKEKHGTIMAAYSMAAMVSSVVGPTYAGLIMDAFGWQGVFVSLFIIGILIIAGGIIFMKNVTDKEPAELNVPYVALSSAGFASFLIGISNISGGLLSLKSGGLILAGIMLLTVFAVLQLKSESPMLNLRVFKYPSFRIAVILSLCMYLIAMGNAMVLPIFTKSLCGFSDTAYGFATIFGSVLAVFSALSAGKLYDKMGIKPMFIAGTGLFGAFSIMGLFLSQNTSIIYIAIIFAFQSVAMSTLNSPTTAMALSGLAGRERVDGSAIFNTLRQISSSLASTISVLIFTLMGSNISAVHSVYVYYILVTTAIGVAVTFYLKSKN